MVAGARLNPMILIDSTGLLRGNLNAEFLWETQKPSTVKWLGRQRVRQVWLQVDGQTGRPDSQTGLM